MSYGILTSVVAFIIAIGVLVTVHEFGHFWVARKLGFKVLRFSLGFGKPLLKRVSRDADQVEYVLAAIPLGGYVRLLDERDGPVPSGEEHRAFNRRPPLARIAVLLAGPGANFLFAILAYWVLLMQGIPGLKPVVGDIAPDSFAARADLRPLDEITAVAGEATPTRQAAVLAILEGVVDEGSVPVEVRREGGATRKLTIRVPDSERRALTEPGILLRGLGFSFWYPPQPVVVAELTPGLPAEAAGLAIGDRVVDSRRHGDRRLHEIRRNDPRAPGAGDTPFGGARRKPGRDQRASRMRWSKRAARSARSASARRSATAADFPNR